MPKVALTKSTLTTEERRTRQVIASQALEGLVTPPDETMMLTQLSTGAISFAEYERWAKGAYIGGS